MNQIRQWINRDDGKWFQIGNESLNCLEIIAYCFLILGFVLIPVREKIYPEIPRWVLAAIFLVSVGLLSAGSIAKKQ